MKETIDSNAKLQEAILVLESKQKEDLNRLKMEFNDLKDRMKPKNILKSGLYNLKHSSRFRTALIISVAAIAGGIITKKMLAKRRRLHHYKKMQFSDTKTNKQVNKVSGSIIRYIIAAILSQNTDKIKSLIYRMLKNLKTSPTPPKENVSTADSPAYMHTSE